VGRKAPREEIIKIRQARAKQILPVKDTSIEKTIQRELTQLGINLVTRWTFSSDPIFV